MGLSGAGSRSLDEIKELSFEHEKLFDLIASSCLVALIEQLKHTPEARFSRLNARSRIREFLPV